MNKDSFVTLSPSRQFSGYTMTSYLISFSVSCPQTTVPFDATEFRQFSSSRSIINEHEFVSWTNLLLKRSPTRRRNHKLLGRGELGAFRLSLSLTSLWHAGQWYETSDISARAVYNIL